MSGPRLINCNGDSDGERVHASDDDSITLDLCGDKSRICRRFIEIHVNFNLQNATTTTMCCHNCWYTLDGLKEYRGPESDRRLNLGSPWTNQRRSREQVRRNVLVMVIEILLFSAALVVLEVSPANADIQPESLIAAMA